MLLLSTSITVMTPRHPAFMSGSKESPQTTKTRRQTFAEMFSLDITITMC